MTGWVFIKVRAPLIPPEESDPAWQLLEEAPLPAPHPWFAMRALARCRREVDSPPPVAWVPRRLRGLGWLLGGSLALGLMAFVLHPVTEPVASPEQANVQQALDYIASLNLNNPADSNSWPDTSL